MKISFYSILFFLAIFFTNSLQAQTCSKTIDSSTPYIDWQNPAFKDIQPGDTVCLQAGDWDYIYLKNFHGTKDKPIVFVNDGGAVIINTDHYFGIKIGACSHVILSGVGEIQANYGFRIVKVSEGAGISVDDYSTDVEIAHVEISNTKIGGVYAKTDPTCTNFGATRDKFVMYNFSFHDNYIHDVPDEGLYIGNSHYAGLYLAGCDTTVYPHAMKGVFIYHNLIENTGWDGIQVSSADSNCQIHDNTINFDSQAGYPNQMSGIMIGGGSVCKTYNNKIIDGKGDGIDVFGMGNFDIFNNLIVNAGKYFHPDDPTQMKHGIYLGKVLTTTDATLGIYNNTIVSPKSFGITLANNELKTVFVKNNLIAAPGKFDDAGDNAFINNNMDANRVVKSNNYKNNNIGEIRFRNASAGNYDLQATSPAVDYGTDLTSAGITFDILNRSRPYGSGFDAGAYEYHNVGIQAAKAWDINLFKVYPNPSANKVNLLVNTSDKQTIQVVVTDITGRVVLRKEMVCLAEQNNVQQLSIRALKEGNYLVVLFSAKGISSRHLFIKK